jgi:hypothetical protein
LGDDVDEGGRYEKFFHGANDKFEVQRGLNNVFAYDLVPSVKVCEAALRACRRGSPSHPAAVPIPMTLPFMLSTDIG